MPFTTIDDISEKHVKQFINLCNAGLTTGLGIPKPGHMCVEAALSVALGLPFGDQNTECVGKTFRRFKIIINDSSCWSSDAVRGNAMKACGIAQIGSNTLDQVVAAKRLSELTIQIIIADLCDKYGYTELAAECRAKPSEKICNKVKNKLSNAFSNASDVAAYAAETAETAAYAANAAANAADAANAAVYAANAAVYAASDASDAAVYAAVYAVYAASDASDAADVYDAANAVLTKACNICLQVLQEMNSPGCKFLYLLDK